MRLTRRALLLSAAALTAAGCVRPAPPPAATAAVWEAGKPLQAALETLLDDALRALHTLETYASFRITTSGGSALRAESEPPWDPPSAREWEEATLLLQDLPGRGQALFERIVNSEPTGAAWRERRELADQAHTFVEVAEAIADYQQATARILPGGDGTGVISLLRTSQERWHALAERAGVRRARTVDCA